MFALAAAAVTSVPHIFCCANHALMAMGQRSGAGAPQQALPMSEWPDNRPAELHQRETNLKGAKQLTFGGQNAEAYWNVAGTEIVYQSTQPGYPDEQIFAMSADGSNRRLISTGKGRTTCSYFSPDGKSIYYSSTHHLNPGPQARPDMREGYIWMVNPQFDLFRKNPQGELETVLRKRGYVAETTIAPDGSFMTFTGGFDGDLEIYRANVDGSNIQRLTDDYGYDGGPFVSWDSKKIVYRRAPKFATREERADYTRLWKQNKVRPGRMDLWVMDADGSNKQQVTRLPGASFAPFMHPDGKRIIFCSNFHDPQGREFDLFIVNTNGSGLRQITFTPDFDGFPMFTRDGKKLIWASNRQGAVPGETNVFTADWVD
jgi:Tol biopolymer transport system component